MTPKDGRAYHGVMRKNASNQSGGTLGACLSAFLALPVHSWR